MCVLGKSPVVRGLPGPWLQASTGVLEQIPLTWGAGGWGAALPLVTGLFNGDGPADTACDHSVMP